MPSDQERDRYRDRDRNDRDRGDRDRGDRNQGNRDRGDRDQQTKLFVTKFPRNYEERDIEDMFDRYGTIRGISMKEGYCFVEFDDQRDA